ncbi:MAG: dethiobiotin synthase [Cycloclasticus sp. symbiont of Bathymodiolus heckerae]|nr:MAG: dethiobiotin synthase [Cycloclasticus sp. symbiont of Bathymodiolus heckerae]
MSAAFFITGTDTDVGKTYISTLLVKGFRERGCRVSGFKPVAAGAKFLDGEFKNEDALELMQEASVNFPYRIVNPYCFEQAIAPHIAAEQEGVEVEMPCIQAAYAKHVEQSELVIIEGAGGWMVPLNKVMGFDDLALAVGAPVILVVSLKLGCINHALLTESAILHKGCRLVGWIANEQKSGFKERDENLEALQQRMKSAYLGLVDHQAASSFSQRNIESLLDYLVDFR